MTSAAPAPTPVAPGPARGGWRDYLELTKPRLSLLSVSTAMLGYMAAVPVLDAIQGYNPLLFDFVLKRHLRMAGNGLPATVFETRRFFDGALS